MIEKLQMLSEVNYPLEEEIKEDFGSSFIGPDGYPRHPKYKQLSISIRFMQEINKIISKQNEIIDRLEIILKSKIGKSMLGLEPDKENGESKN